MNLIGETSLILINILISFPFPLKKTCFGGEAKFVTSEKWFGRMDQMQNFEIEFTADLMELLPSWRWATVIQMSFASNLPIKD